METVVNKKGGESYMRGSAFVWLLGGIALVIIFVVAVPIYFEDARVNEPQFGIGGGPDVKVNKKLEQVASSDIHREPGEYLGRLVIVAGAVTDVLNNKAFVIDSEENEGERMLILVNNEMLVTFMSGDLSEFNNNLVSVTGVVEEFDAQNISQRYGIEIDEGWNGELYINAVNVNILE